MQDMQRLLQEPEGSSGQEYQVWFRQWAEWLLGNCWLMAGGHRLRVAEVEFYYFGEKHEDLFAHRHPVQQTPGAWYFHRTGNSYKNGTYKGLDLSFGNSRAFGGILLRSMVTEDDQLIDGPALCVDHLLQQTGCPNVAALDAQIAGHPAWETSSPLHLLAAENTPRPLFSSARVGLTLNKAKQHASLPHFICLSYRFLTEPQRIKKGRTLLLLSLHISGMTAAEIQTLTGSPRGAIERSVAAYEAAHRSALVLPDFQALIGRYFTSDDLAQLHGIWQAIAKR